MSGEWRVASGEWRVMSDEWRVMSGKIYVNADAGWKEPSLEFRL